MMIEQSDIVEIYSQDDFSSVTIKMRKQEAKELCKKMGLSSRLGAAFKNQDGQMMVHVMDRKTEFYSR
jgi:hypothetical protein